MSELALVNAQVYRPSDGSAPATAVLVRDGRIAALGSDAEVWAVAGPRAEVLDLHGAALLPGFTESHTHFHRTAILREHFLDFDDPAVTKIDDVLARVRDRAATLAPGQWLQGDNLVGGRLTERRLPTRQELQAVAPANPVLLRGMGKHVVVANDLALDRAGIDATTPDPPGGRIERDVDGRPTGVLHERGKLRLDTTRADTVVPPLDEAERLTALEAGIRWLHQAGVTSIHEIARTPDELGDYARLREQDRLRMRVVSYLRVVEGRTTLDGVLATGIRSGFGDEWLRVGGVKVSVDGACTFRNAALYEPYRGEPDNLGITRVEQDELNDLVDGADAGGLQVAVHAIGPRAVDMSLDAFARLGPRRPASRRRHRIEHAYLPQRGDQFARMRDLGLILSTQPGFIRTVGDAWFDIFPEEQVAGMVPLRSALRAGLTVLANSDCPTAPPHPLLGIQAAVTRTTAGGRRLADEQAVPVGEAIDMYTAAPAYAAGEEHERGRIEVGRRADLVGLAAHPAAVPAAELADVPVVLTVIGGTPVHRIDER